MVDTFPPGLRLSADEVEELMQHIGRLAEAGFPLAEGMRAAAEECESGRVSAALREFAERLEKGESLAEILSQSQRWLPPSLGGLIVAALRSGRLGEALLELAEQQRTARYIHSGLRRALSYPLIIGALAAVWLGGLSLWLSQSFAEVYDSFQMKLPMATRQLFWWRDTGIWLLLVLGLLLAGAAWLYRRRQGDAAWSRLLVSFPLLGPLWHARGLAEWSGLMSVLLKSHVPLPEALAWSGDGVSNAWVAECSRRWADQVAGGTPISEVLSGSRDFPAGLTPLIQWGERHGTLDDAIATSRDALERRVRLRTELLQTILPAMLFVVIGTAVLTLVVALFLPIFQLLQSLT